MKAALKRVERVVFGLALVAAGLVMVGCGTVGTTDSPAKAAGTSEKPPEVSEELRVGDSVTVKFSGILNPPKDHEERIKEDGYINLPYGCRIKADGLTTGLLQKQIKDYYVPTYYLDLTVTVTSENRFFYIGGEVRAPSRQIYATKITVLGAISSAGGFTDFASKTKVKLTRANGEIHIIDCKKAQTKPKLDLQVYPGDQIEVPRRLY
jgi:protein involved in polysaccharide export with SLBB domain